MTPDEAPNTAGAAASAAAADSARRRGRSKYISDRNLVIGQNR
jgi:hypothetical protein